MIVRWGLGELEPVLRELGIDRPFLLATRRWDSPLEAHARFSELPTSELERAIESGGDFDGIAALGGGSTIDTGKAISAHTGRPLVSIPTTYAGAEWTPYFGIRDAGRKMRGGGAGAHLAAIVYEPELTLSLPRAETVGTAMNALAHCAEALYVQGHNPEADEHALAGARLIGEHLPRVVESPHDLGERTRLLEGAAHGGEALARSMLALGHALAQAIGGRYGLPHGALNAICLPAVLRFNREAAPDAIDRLGEAIRGDAVQRIQELARMGGFERLRDLSVPEEDLPALAEAASERAGAKANPRPASPAEILELLRSVY